jgi:uncharacterized protein YdeI (YjbR/CyaY-like superfamily)
MFSPDYKTFHPMTRKAWREWLQENHASSPGIWMIYYKKQSGKRKLEYGEAVEEALCFGWIDSLPRKLDEQRAMLKFTPRKPKSAWSRLNKTRITKLIRAGLMTVAGLGKIEQAKKDGSWDKLTSSDSHIDSNSIPVELRKALSKRKKALENFNSFPPGYRKRFLFWIDSAKQPGTRKARIQQTVRMVLANKKPGSKGFKL